MRDAHPLEVLVKAEPSQEALGSKPSAKEGGSPNALEGGAEPTAADKHPVTPRPRTSSMLGRWSPVYVGVFAFTLSVIGSNRPWFWGDEAATISVATRSLPDLWRFLGTRDGHQGLYYVFMHFWYSLFPANEFASRLPSGLAVGFAAAGVVVLGRQLSTQSTAVTAGIVLAVLPRATFAGTETRPYAIAMAFAVWLTVLCVYATKRDRPEWWLAYGMSLLFAIVFNFFLVLMLPVHAVAAWSVARYNAGFRRWSIAAGGAAVAAAPFLFLFVQKQQNYSTWIPPLSASTIPQVFQEQYFILKEGYSGIRLLAIAVVAAIIMAAAIAVGFRAGARRPGPLIVVALTWVIVPTVALLAYSALSSPAYYPRYLAFTAPAFALILGSCIVIVGQSRTRIAGLVIMFALVAAPVYFAQREPEAKGRMDYGQVADTLDRNAGDGDCLLVDDSKDPRRWWPLRDLLTLRPSTYERLRDPALAATAAQKSQLRDEVVPISTVADELRDCEVIWTLSARDDSLPPGHQEGANLSPGPRLGQTSAYQIPSKFGFRVIERWQFPSTQVTKSTRRSYSG